MRFSSPFGSVGASILLAFPILAGAVRLIESSALEQCDVNSNLTASLFNVVFTPDNNTVTLDVVGDSFLEGNVTLRIVAVVYGYTILTETLDPCTLGIPQMCPLTEMPLEFDNTYTNISNSFISRIPSIAYGVPDLDATVTVFITAVDNPGVDVACLRTRLSNGKTVNHSAVGWATAVVAGIGLLTSGVVSGMGHLNTATHIVVYALSLFNYFQAIAIIGLCAVPLPPIVQAWTQDFAWSVGIIRVGFLQKLASWSAYFQ